MHTSLLESLRNIARNTGGVVMEKDVRKHYTMQNMADISCVNKSSVYRFLKKKNIKPVTTEHNTQYYSSNTMQQVKKHFKTDNSNADKKSDHDLLLETLQQQVADLKKELAEEKVRADSQLKEKDKQIAGYQKLIDQSQQLLLNEQNNKSLPDPDKTVQEGSYSESKSNNKDSSLEERITSKGQIDQVTLNKTKKQNPKGHWWHKLFGSN